ncbi:MAG: hypothetical protein MJ180_00470 [Candidatus Gastranaerophilales bacterium]|nr:hypothetical protein [Candidatus Gastranaerophilales bacterium]
MAICDKFVKEAEKNPNFTYKHTNEIIKKFFPYMKIHYWEKAKFASAGVFQPYEFAIYILKRNLKKKNALNDFLVTVIHELTHACQELDAEMSRNTMINRYAAKRGERNFHSIYAITKKESSQLITRIYIEAAIFTDNLNKKTSEVYKKLPQIRNEIKELLAGYINKFKSKPAHKQEDIDFYIKNLYYTLVNEYDAYKVSNQFLTKSGFKIQRDDKLVESLIKTAYKSIEKEAMKK